MVSLTRDRSLTYKKANADKNYKLSRKPCVPTRFTCCTPNLVYLNPIHAVIQKYASLPKIKRRRNNTSKHYKKTQHYSIHTGETCNSNVVQKKNLALSCNYQLQPVLYHFINCYLCVLMCPYVIFGNESRLITFISLFERLLKGQCYIYISFIYVHT